MIRVALAVVIVNAALVRSPLLLPQSELIWLFPFVVAGLLLQRTRLIAILGATVLLTTISIDKQMALRVSGAEAGLQTLTIRVIGLPSKRAGVTRFLAVTGSEGRRIRVSWYQPTQTIAPGQVWQMLVRLSEPTGSINFDLFDYEAWLFVKRIHGTASVRSSTPPILLANSSSVVSVDALRFQMRQKLSRHGPPENVGVLLALALGDTSQLGQADWRILNQTGTTHLLIVSGLHIGLVAGLLVLIAKLFRIGRIGTFVITILGICAYALLAGWGLPVQRALIMTCVVMGVTLIGRQIGFGTQLATAMLLVLMFDPLATLSNGFWLSFGAVAMLLYGLSNRQATTRSLRVFLELLRSQWVVFVGLMPFLALLVGNLPLLSIVINLFAIPFVGLLLVPVLLICLLLVSIGINAAILTLPAFLVHVLWQGLATAASFQMLLPVPSISIGVMVLAVAAVLLSLAPRGLMPRWPAVLLIMVLWSSSGRPQFGELRMTFLDVGQGLAVLVETAEGALLYDTGPSFRDRFSAVQQMVLPTLRSKGITELDYLVISHGDNDHAGGVAELLRATNVKHHLKPGRCDHVWQAGGVTFRSWFIESGTGNNDLACVLLIVAKHHVVLLTGDLEVAGERELLKLDLPLVDAMSSPHHGSISSSTPALLNYFRPDIVVVSAGYKNRFGHPDEKVLARYDARSMRTLDTARHGAVELFSSSQGLHVRTARQPDTLWRRYEANNPRGDTGRTGQRE